jgi:ectoine hydroxylase-related dioxygenase (phytanoyl-CoA dioxygenase family)
VNPGLIWLDESGAGQAIEDKLGLGAITEAEAEDLRKFARDGYCIVAVDLSAAAAAELDGDVDRLWRQKPHGISFAYDSPPLRFSEADEEAQRKPRYRIHELHAASPTALRLMLDATLHRYASLILGETAVATQSLYFEFGSQQPLHRDSTVVPSPEFGRLVAAWIALEDIAAESGPLAYVPGSQKFPFYAFRPGEFCYDPSRHSGADVEAAVRFYDDELRKSGLPSKQFLAKRGDVLIWHSALMHGGAQPLSPERTRKSFVIHYSSLRTQPTRLGAVREAGGGQSVYETSQILERNGAYAFGNPLEGKFLYQR